MPAIQRYTNLAAVVLPFLAFIAAIGLLPNSVVGWSDLAILVAMYLVSAFGITIGYHRLLTHRAFQTYKPLEYALAMAGSMAVQGPVIDWVADHRKHHANTDIALKTKGVDRSAPGDRQGVDGASPSR